MRWCEFAQIVVKGADLHSLTSIKQIFYENNCEESISIKTLLSGLLKMAKCIKTLLSTEDSNLSKHCYLLKILYKVLLSTEDRIKTLLSTEDSIYQNIASTDICIKNISYYLHIY